jgi:NAD(P)-dependent dehydrogenase (short-subunit alcohol dehydrogenase family)
MKGLTQVLGEPARVARSFVNGYEAMIAVRPLLIGDIMMPTTLQGRKVVVLGGTSGIGLAVAKAVLADGATVVVGSHNRAKIDAAVAALGMSATGGVLNVNDESSIMAFFEQVGPLDHLVYTAGDWKRRNNNIGNNFDLTDAQAGFGIRFWGALLAVKHAMPMIAPDGSITLTGGVLAHRPQKGAALSTAIAGAAEHLMRGLAVDLAPLRVNLVAPGLIATEVWSQLPEGAMQRMVNSQPLPRPGLPEEVAEAYLYFMRAGYTTGQVAIVDGGRLFM